MDAKNMLLRAGKTAAAAAAWKAFQLAFWIVGNLFQLCHAVRVDDGDGEDGGAGGGGRDGRHVQAAVEAQNTKHKAGERLLEFPLWVQL